MLIHYMYHNYNDKQNRQPLHYHKNMEHMDKFWLMNLKHDLYHMINRLLEKFIRMFYKHNYMLYIFAG